MARALYGPFGSATGSGTEVTVTLDGTVQPTELLLALVVFEPLALPDTYSSGGNTFHKTVIQSDVWLADSSDFTDWGIRTATATVGFWEIPHLQAGRGTAFPYPDVTGRPCYSGDFPEAQPSGISSSIAGYWHPDPFNQLTFTFAQISPTTPYSVPWTMVRTWKISEWGGTPRFPSGTVGANRPEGDELVAETPGPPPTDLWHHAVMQGEEYIVLGPSLENIPVISDGGDTQRGWGANPMVNHALEYGIAGRWGQGTGTFTWDTWPGATLLTTIDRAQPHADAHLEIYYRLAGTTLIEAGGTFGPQTYTQDAPGNSWRGRPVAAGNVGAMQRGAAMRVAVPSGGWMPQIYRRVGPAQ